MRLLIPALLALSFAGCSCQRQPDPDASVAPPAAQTPDDAQTRAQAAAAQRAQAQSQQRLDAMTEAVDELHQYLQQLGSGKREQADKHWAYQRLPRGNEEADLRALDNLRAIRIENDTPKQLDQEAQPEMLEIPVDLRVSLQDGENRRYKGWYRMKRNPVDRRWELIGVSIAVVLR
ncbi:hypothetical protein [Lysobacter capsici]|uniref:hypothetical protein n=1 Tax=Lysobacter capsici TaxID=435897 RepID=UPI001C0052EA|nr:hypothetical protein [Lysobacter capsici]QWF18413.1 hypothetical protein KME82_06560 [Lysobacter capsici]